MIPQKMSSQTELAINGIDLLTVTKIEVIVQQGEFYKCIEDASVVSSDKLVFRLSGEDAAQLNYKKPVNLQVLYTDAYGNGGHTDVVYATVDQVIKDGVYGN